MSQHARKPTRAGVAAAVLAASMLSVGLLAPSATAATMTSQQGDGSTLLPCDAKWGGYYCDLNDIASVLSGALDPALKLTCIDPQANLVVCRVNSDNTPYDGSN